MNELRARQSSPTNAAVDIIESPKAPRKAPKGSAAAFIARNQGRMDETSDQIVTQDGTGTAVHTRPGTVVMYKPTERNGWIPRTVSSSAMPMLFKQGWQEFCPDCGQHHLDRKGNITTDPNACSSRDPVAVRICPVDGKRIYDNLSLAQIIDEAEYDDPNVIKDDPYSTSTPEQRTKLKLDLHLWIRHPEWAQANGVPPLPAAFRDMVEQGATGKGT